MEPKRITLKIPPGIYRTGTNAQSQGRWFEGQLVRFWENTRRPVGGWRRLLSSILMPPNGGGGGGGGEEGEGAGPMGGGGSGGSEALAPVPGVTRKLIAWRMSGEPGTGLRKNAPAMAIGSTKGLAILANGVYYDVTPVDFVEGREDSSFADTAVNQTGSEEIFSEDGFTYHVFESDGVFEVFAGELEVQMILVAGGGGRGVDALGPLTGGGLVFGRGGGGGAGAAEFFDSVTLGAGSYAVVVGAGGVLGASGEDSTFGEDHSVEGGGAGGSDGAGVAGGCGGGGGSPPYPSDNGFNPPYAPYDDLKYDHALKGGGAGNGGGSGGSSSDNDPGSVTFTGGAGGGGGMGGAGADAVAGGGLADGGAGISTPDLADGSWHDFGEFSAGGPALAPQRPGNGSGTTDPGRPGIVIVRYPTVL